MLIGGVIDLVYDYSLVESSTIKSVASPSGSNVWMTTVANLSGATANGKIAVIADFSQNSV